MSPPLPRGVCPVCRRDVATRVSGQVREHYATSLMGKIGEAPCPGSGKFAVVSPYRRSA